MLSDSILDSEWLYRAINPMYFREVGFSTSAFKDKKGASVDRDGDREEPVIIHALLTGLPEWGAVRLLAQVCRACDTFPIAKAEPENRYHAEIHQSKDRVKISKTRLKCLTDKATLVHRPPTTPSPAAAAS